MHKKQKGNIGELLVAADLAKRGHAVFAELGDLSKVDLIALKDNKPLRIQVKARTQKNNSVRVETKKSGPNYKFSYQAGDFDIVAVVNLTNSNVYYVSASEFLKFSSTFTLKMPGDKYRNLP